jgi:hypothetical protein
MKKFITNMQLGKAQIDRYDADYQATTDDSALATVKDSLLTIGQISPIDYTVVNGQPKIVNGYDTYNILCDLIANGDWTEKIKVREIPTDQALDYFVAHSFAHKHYTSMQRAMFGAHYLYDAVAAANKNNSRKHKTNDSGTTVAKVAAKVASNAEYVRLCKLLHDIDTWFFTFFWQINGKMTKDEITEFTNLTSKNQKKVIEAMQKIIESSTKISKSVYRDATKSVGIIDAAKDMAIINNSLRGDDKQRNEIMDMLTGKINNAVKIIQWTDIIIPGKITLDFAIPQALKESLSAIMFNSLGRQIEWKINDRKGRAIKLTPEEAEFEQLQNDWVDEYNAAVAARKSGGKNDN